MSGNQGNLKDIVALKKKYNFRLFVDDAHGFGTMGETGAGTGEAQGVQDGIDIYFGTFAKAMASIGGFVACEPQIAKFIRYNIRSQMFAKSLPMPIVIGALKRLDLIRKEPQLRENLWTIVNALQSGLKEKGFNIGTTTTQVTPIILSGSIPEATLLTQDLRENYDLFCSIVSFPVVPRGVIILRIIPTAMHTLEDVQYTIDTFGKVAEKLKSGGYQGEFATVEVDKQV
jgi:glycine C-acetyltransferase